VGPTGEGRLVDPHDGQHRLVPLVGVSGADREDHEGTDAHGGRGADCHGSGRDEADEGHGSPCDRVDVDGRRGPRRRSRPENGACYPAATADSANFVEEESMRVLVVEDHQQLAETIATGLRREGMAVDVAVDGATALELGWVNRYAVVVLDRDLPGVHGDEVCRALGAGESAARILMLTAAGTVEDRVAGLSLGADDYLPKPFAFAELVARIRSLARRAQPAVPPVLVWGDLRLDPARRVAVRGGRLLDLSPKELAVLELLLAAGGAVVSAEELLERAWDATADPFTHTVKVTVSRLRRKLGGPPVVETVARAGYRMALAAGGPGAPGPPPERP
jgi:DNA-binding response OmpR family regulator